MKYSIAHNPLNNMHLLHTSYFWKHFTQSVGPTLGWNKWWYITSLPVL